MSKAIARLREVKETVAGRSALVGGAALFAGGIVQIVHSQADAGSRVVGLAGHLVLGFFIVSLIAIAPAFVAVSRYAQGRRARQAGIAVACATALLGVTCITSMVMGHDGVWFNVIAPITNLVWFAGSIVIAIGLRRAGRVPAIVAFGLPVAWAATILAATHGGGVLSGAYFLMVGYLMANEALESGRASELAVASS